MTKKIIAFALIAFAALAVYSTSVFAQTTTQASGTHHDEMQSIFELGTYEDLVELREIYDRPFMRWVDSADDFELAKDRHALMKGTGFEHKGQRGSSNVKGQGSGFMGVNCPMA
ncbi:hypothetical protein GQ473_05925 [archaeon]|nr:hypothetical protein [archaeon]